MSFLWAKNYPDLLNLCEKFNLMEVDEAKEVCYKPCVGITQEGPQCGLVALAICMEMPNKETIERLLDEAQSLGYTYNGEMFSAKEMLELAQRNLSHKVTLYDGFLDSQEIKRFLLNGGLMLVPYDSDRNHAPCEWKGHKAHWAVILGIIDTEEVVYVIARHGKSKNIAIWNLLDLARSNSQLEEFSPDRKLHDVKYKLPEGGVGGANGLKYKSICIWPLS